MTDDGVTLYFDEERVHERIDDQRLDGLDEVDQVIVAYVPGRHQE